MEVMNDWSHSGDRGYLLDFIYLDYRKAFVSVMHHRLLEKLSKYGIKGKILEWIIHWKETESYCQWRTVRADSPRSVSVPHICK